MSRPRIGIGMRRGRAPGRGTHDRIASAWPVIVVGTSPATRKHRVITEEVVDVRIHRHVDVPALVE